MAPNQYFIEQKSRITLFKGLGMSNKNPWDQKASNYLKAELARKGLTYDDLRLALEKKGIHKTTTNLNKTINLGKFSFAFFLQCADAIGLEKVLL